MSSNQDIQFKVHTLLDFSFISLIKRQMVCERLLDEITQSNLIKFLRLIYTE